MRKLTRLPAERARVLVEVLVGAAIPARAEPADPDAEVWVVDDNDLPRARELLDDWMRSPDDPRFVAARAQAADLRARERVAARARSDAAIRLDRARRAVAAGPVTLLTVLLAIGFTLLGIPSLTALPDAIVRLPDPSGITWALIDDLRVGTGPDGLYVPFLGAVRAGEVWRLFTPVFVHTGGLLHLAFNGYWVWTFGRQIETRKGSALLAALILVFSVVSMVSQYAVGWWMIDPLAAARGVLPTFTVGPIYLGGPIAGGLSGTLYGLFGYVWAKSATDRFGGLGVPSSTVGLLLVWLLVCFTGTVGPIANVAHAAGLVAGVLWGAGGHRLHRSL